MEDLYLIALKTLKNAEKSVGLLTDLSKSLYSVDTYCRLSPKITKSSVGPIGIRGKVLKWISSLRL